jgi:hypothetical protein
MLTFDPSARITVLGALEHPWLASYHDVNDEPECPQKFEKWRKIEELQNLEQFREALWNEIEDYRREVRGVVLDLGIWGMGTTPGSGRRKDEGGQDEAIPGHTADPVIPNGERDTDSKATKTVGPEVDETAKPIITASPDSGFAPSSLHPEHLFPISPADPVVTYARRSSILQPSRRGSTYISPHPSQQPASSFTEGPIIGEPGAIQGTGSMFAFPTQSYVVPARSRTGSTTGGGEVTRKLLRTLSTVSIHETGEGLPGGLGGIAPIGKYIVDQTQTTGADAPPSEIPREFGIDEGSEDEEDGNDERGGRKYKGEKEEGRFRLAP